ncbi:hypothetical protein G5V59_02470 [Nocardioides sp. W3-2-3]|uniref:hypothetical protein n=1 Tax=Nocardioides convexus TaxID=2712224 RepID=UPI0024185431|nr:hypothetical protein [Nocardioides convexus]NGZ99617.1 hypothetical protein [Nocardioides convexus]
MYAPPKGNPARSNPGLGLLAPGAVPHAEGGTVQGPRHPYGDKVLTYLAPGEEVITNRNGQADRFRADRAAGRIPAYADGGTVQALASGGTVHTRSHSDREADHVARGLKKMRQEARVRHQGPREGDEGPRHPRRPPQQPPRGRPQRPRQGHLAPGQRQRRVDQQRRPRRRALRPVGRHQQVRRALRPAEEEGQHGRVRGDHQGGQRRRRGGVQRAPRRAGSRRSRRLYGVVQSRLNTSSNRASDAVYAAPIAKANARLAETTREVKGLRGDLKHATKVAEKQQARNRAAAKKGAASAASRRHRGYVKP